MSLCYRISEVLHSMVGVGQSSKRSLFLTVFHLWLKKYQEIKNFDRSYFIPNFVLYNSYFCHFYRKINGNREKFDFSDFLTKKIKFF